MPVRNELCRNFQRGSCQYGARCKFVHAIPQQQQQNHGSNNPFGFGKQQHQKPNSSNPNPFGFGSQANSATNKQSQQFKPFENKWSRFNPLSSNPAAGPSSKQQDSQSQQSNHKCTDPDACKSMISEDFEKEKPLWKLTCYGHLKNGPCDITGDISFEELRAAAYADAKSGLSLHSIVEKERNLWNSKLLEFENLLRSPYKAPPSSNIAAQGLSPVATPIGFSPNGQSGAPPTVSSFGQLGTSLNLRPSSTSNNSLSQLSPFSSSSQTSSTFGIRPSAPSNNAFAQANPSSNTSLSSGAPLFNQFPSANSGSFSNHLPYQASGYNTGFGNGDVSTKNNSFSSSAMYTQNLNLSSVQTPIIASEPYSSSAAGQNTKSSESGNNVRLVNDSGDASIWLKDKWFPGEIPEEAPPLEFIR